MKVSKKLNTQPTKLAKQLALVIGLGMFTHSAIADLASCTVSSDGLTNTCTGQYSPYDAHRLNYDNVIFNITGNWGVAPDIQGIGIYANGDRRTAQKNVTITTNGSAADAIRTNNGGVVEIPGRLIIEATGSSADGVNVTESSSNAAVIFGNDANVTSVDGIGLRANMAKNAGTVNKIIAGDGLTILTKGSGSNFADARGYGVYAGMRYGTNQQGGAEVIIGKNSSITTQGSVAHAVYANKGGEIFLGDNAIVTTGNKNAYALYALTGNAGRGNMGSKIKLAGNVTIIVPTGGSAMYSSGAESLINSAKLDGTVASGIYAVTGDLVADREGSIKLSSTAGSVFTSNVNAIGAATPSGTGNTLIDLTMSGTQLTGNIDARASGLATLNASANSIIVGNITANTSGVVNFSADHSSYTGDITAFDNGSVQMALTNGALFTGMVDMTNAAASAGVSAGVANITMDGATTHWQMTGDSNVKNLVLTNGAQISIGDQTVLPVTSANKSTLIVENLSGTGGIFNARTEMCHDEADLLIIKNSSSGDHYLHFDDAKSGAYFGAEEAMVVHFQGIDPSLNQATFNSHGVDVGAYIYTLELKIDSNWYLNVTPTTNPSDPGGPPAPPPINKTAKHSADILNINYLLNHAENQTLLQRMGELRSSTSNQGDVWGRIYTGQLDKFAGKRLSSFDMDYTGVQFGADKRLEGINNGEVYIGVMAGAGKADAKYAIGNADTKSYHLGAYGTYQADDGLYVDGFAKYVRMNNGFNTQTSNGYDVTGDGNTTGYSIGVEVGKRFYISQPSQGWYLEPQGQLTLSHQNGATINSSTGLRTDLDSYDSTLGRVSIIAGYSIVEGKNPVDVYIKTGYVREFSGNTGYAFNGKNHERYDFGGGWWDNGIGANMQIAQRHNIYLDASYAKGGSFDKKQLNLGYRFDF